MGGLLAAPKVQKPRTEMPSEDDPAVIAARRRPYEALQSQSGRASTILSDALQPYSNDKLGKIR
jgi:hypothetical protein